MFWFTFYSILVGASGVYVCGGGRVLPGVKADSLLETGCPCAWVLVYQMVYLGFVGWWLPFLCVGSPARNPNTCCLSFEVIGRGQPFQVM